MILYIDDGVEDLINSASASGADFLALENLCMAAAEGSHRVTGRRRVLNSIADNANLSKRAKAILLRASGRFSQDGNLYKKMKIYGRVNAGGAAVVSSFSGNQRIINFPLRWFDKSSKVQPPYLLGEDISDARLLKRIGEAGTVLNEIGHLPLACNPDHGGGSGVVAVLGHHAANSNLCLCVVDSDRASPLSDLGGTALRAVAYNNMASYPLLSVAVTASRDIENMLPDSFYNAQFAFHLRNLCKTHGNFGTFSGANRYMIS